MYREENLSFHWSGVVHEADDVVGGRCGMAGDLAELPVMITGPVPEVGADGKGGTDEATCETLVRDEAVASRQNA